jgi:hypothetical protein
VVEVPSQHAAYAEPDAGDQTQLTEFSDPLERCCHGGVVVLGELAEVSVAVVPEVVDVGAVLRGLEVVDEVIDVVVPVVEVAVDVGALVAGAEVDGPERVAAGDPDPPWLATVPAGTGRTRRYRASTARKASTSRRVEVRSLPCSSVGGSRPGITGHRCPAR